MYLTNDLISWADWLTDFCMVIVMEWFLVGVSIYSVSLTFKCWSSIAVVFVCFSFPIQVTFILVLSIISCMGDYQTLTTFLEFVSYYWLHHTGFGYLYMQQCPTLNRLCKTTLKLSYLCKLQCHIHVIRIMYWLPLLIVVPFFFALDRFQYSEQVQCSVSVKVKMIWPAWLPPFYKFLKLAFVNNWSFTVLKFSLGYIWLNFLYFSCFWWFYLHNVYLLLS